jgi:hypothetical protein
MLPLLLHACCWKLHEKIIKLLSIFGPILMNSHHATIENFHPFLTSFALSCGSAIGSSTSCLLGGGEPLFTLCFTAQHVIS